jgi:Fe-S cluster assembly protein SufD
VDNYTCIEHTEPNCPSHELYKSVLGGAAVGVFRGEIFVNQKAQKTDSKQTSRALLLTDTATMHSQPVLRIFADDVKCTHGATIGPLDEEQLFFLRSRGIGVEAAKHLLIYAFLAQTTDRINIEPVRRRLEALMAARHDLPLDLRI